METLPKTLPQRDSRWLEFQINALNATSIVAITNRVGDIVFVNDKFCEISGFSRNELLHQNHRILNSGFHPKEFFENMWETISNGRIWRGTIRNRKKDGTYYWVDSHIIPYLNEQNFPLFYVSIRVDVTSRIKAEQDLLAAQEDQLNSKVQLLSYMSHEIRNPLAAIIGIAELALAKDANQETRRLIEIVRNTAEDLVRITTDVLDDAKFGAGMLNLSPSHFDINAMVNRIFDLWQPRAKRKGIELEASIDSATPQIIYGDSARLSQVLVNLLSNALKATERGFVRLNIVNDEHNISFSVSDTGIGIPEKSRDQLFKDFSQLQKTGSRAFDGSGLGLSISKKIVTAMGGEIGFDSTEGKGSVFWFRIPKNPKTEFC